MNENEIQKIVREMDESDPPDRDRGEIYTVKPVIRADHRRPKKKKTDRTTHDEHRPEISPDQKIEREKNGTGTDRGNKETGSPDAERKDGSWRDIIKAPLDF